MFRKIPLALLAGAATLVSIHTASAIEASVPAEPRAAYADQTPPQPAPVRVASAERSGMGGGFIEFLFSDGQSGRRPPPQPAYDPRRALLPPMDPQQSMRPQYEASDPEQRPFDPRYEKQVVDYHGKEGAGTIVVDTPNKFLYLVQGDGKALPSRRGPRSIRATSGRWSPMRASTRPARS